MSRSQFVRNTLSAIQMQLQPSNRQSSTTDLTYDDWSSVRGGSDAGDGAPPSAMRNRIKRSDSMTSWSSVTRDGLVSTLGVKHASTGQLSSTSTSDTPAHTPATHTPINESRVSVISSGQDSKSPDVVSPNHVHDRTWELDMESMLKVGLPLIY